MRYFLLLLMIVTLSVAGNEDEEQEQDLTWKGFLKTIKTETNSLMRRLLPYVVRSLSVANVSQDCERGLMNYALSLSKMKSWAIHMADSTGKPPSGILDGTVMEFGSFDRCLKIRLNHSSGEEAFRGRYCMLGIQTQLFQPITQNYIDLYGLPPDWFAGVINKAGAYWKNGKLWIGACFPSLCSEDEILRIAQSVAKPLALDFSSAGCQVEGPQEWTTSAFISVCILCCLAGLCLIGTLSDALQRCFFPKLKSSESDSNFLRFWKSFSLVANTEKLFTVSEGREPLGCFHGIRFFSATWVVLGHTYFFTERWKFLKFRSSALLPDDFNRSILYAIPENFTLPVGSFFFISGFLLVYGMWKHLQKNEGKIDILKFFIHKYWRMTPALGLVIVMFLALPMIGSGPLWNSTLDPSIEACEARWWTNILYINNFWNTDQYCLIHTWFLAALMQYHIVGVCLLLLCYRFPLLGKVVGFGIAIITCFITSLTAFYYSFPMPAPAHIGNYEIFESYLSQSYIRTFCHVSSYLIGMAVAFMYLKYKDQEMKMSLQILGWIVATAMSSSALFGIYGPAESLMTSAFYIGFHRIGFVGGLGWLVFACITHRGGIINRFLSWKAFSPLGTLSYLVYLVHPLIMLFRTASLRERINYGNAEMIFEYLNYTLIAFFLAFLGHIAVEKPFLILDGIFLGRKQLSCCKQEKESEVVLDEIKSVKL